MSFWYDRQGKVLVHMDIHDPEKKWLNEMQKVDKLLRDRKYKVVQQDFTPNKKYWVSTVWLGLDHGYNWPDLDKPNPHPIIFETMVFNGDSYNEMDRYETEAQALAGHKKMLAKYTRKESREVQSS